jgi:hypothetical protein
LHACLAMAASIALTTISTGTYINHVSKHSLVIIEKQYCTHASSMCLCGACRSNTSTF